MLKLRPRPNHVNCSHYLGFVVSLNSLTTHAPTKTHNHSLSVSVSLSLSLSLSHTHTHIHTHLQCTLTLSLASKNKHDTFAVEKVNFTLMQYEILQDFGIHTSQFPRQDQWERKHCKILWWYYNNLELHFRFFQHHFGHSFQCFVNLCESMLYWNLSSPALLSRSHIRNLKLCKMLTTSFKSMRPKSHIRYL